MRVIRVSVVFKGVPINHSLKQKGCLLGTPLVRVGWFLHTPSACQNVSEITHFWIIVDLQNTWLN